MRSSFFLLAPNSALPMQKLVERMRRRYPFSHGRFSSLYMLGYADAKYIDGTISNWKQTYAFYEHVQRVLAAKPSLAKFRRLQRYLRGVEGVDLMARVAPDFILVFAADRGAAHEAANADIPLVGMADSDVSPAPFLYPVFGNDDSVASVAFMVDLLSRAVEEGRKSEHELTLCNTVPTTEWFISANIQGAERLGFKIQTAAARKVWTSCRQTDEG